MKRSAPGARSTPTRRSISPALPAPLQVRADLLGLRRRVDPALRRRPRPAPRRLAPAALQPVQPRRLRPGAARTSPSGSAPSTRPTTTARRARDPVRATSSSRSRRRRIGPQLLPRQRRPQLGDLDHRPHRLHPRAILIPLTYKQIKGDARAAGAAAADQGDPGEVQERPPAPAAGDDGASTRRTKSTRFASCLPLLLQLPVFIALFRAPAQRQLPAKTSEAAGGAELRLLHQLP